MKTVEITPAIKITCLKHLANGRDKDFVAQVTGISTGQVLDLASHHGYPDTDKMRWAVDVLTKDAKQAALDALPTTVAPISAPITGVRPGAASRPATPTTAVRPMTPAPQPVRVDATADQLLPDLLRTAQVTGDKKIARLAARADAAVTALNQALTAWATAATERAAAAREAEVKATRIAKLQAELAQLTGKPVKTKGKQGGATGGPQTCDQCGRTFGSKQAITTHRRRTHEGFNPRAAHTTTAREDLAG